MSLEGRVVVITGGTRGLGRALARASVAAGAHVLVCGRTAAEAEPGVVAIVADVTRDAGRLVETAIARWGRIDVLVNNAGLAAGAFEDVLATNAGGALACARAVLAVNPRARIVNVSSGIVAVPRAGAAEY